MATLRWSVVAGLLDELKPRRTLEVGCGQGGFGARLAARSDDYLGVEPDERSFTLARDRIAPLGGRVLHGTSDLVPISDRFDLVCAFEVVEHLEDDAGAVGDWAQRLAPGGAMLLSVPAWQRRFGPMDERVGHYRRYEPDQIDAVLDKAGLVRARHVLYGWPLGYALETVRNRIARRLETTTEDSMSDRSATSGRLLQPRELAGAAVRVSVAPFTLAQRLRPTAGTGLVAVAHRPG